MGIKAMFNNQMAGQQIKIGKETLVSGKNKYIQDKQLVQMQTQYTKMN